MQKEISTSFALVMFASALAVSFSVALFAFSLQGRILAGGKAQKQGELTRNQDQSTAQLHAFAQATASERASLKALLQTDILSIATMLTGAGKAAGVSLEVSGAQSRAATTLKGSKYMLSAVSFTVTGQGTFAKLMDAAGLLEALPIAGSIEHIDMSRVSPEGNTRGDFPWQFSTRIRVLTTAQNVP
ncbi:MAG TPA: hypothetical protein VJG64_03740 [Candidatus Paceibacterota bacterium]